MAFVIRFLIIITAFDCGFTIQMNPKQVEPDRTQGPTGDPKTFASDGVEYPTVHYTVNCSGINKTFPADMLLIKGKVLWCPNAKVGTSTIFSELKKLFGVGHDIRCDAYNPCNFAGKYQNVRYASWDDLCSATSYSFIRNPWDRLMSGYTDKIATGSIDPWTETPEYYNGKLQKHPGGTPSFPEFLRYIVNQSPEDLNGHWMPSSERCLTSGTEAFNYDHIHKIEDNFDKYVKNMLVDAGFDGHKVDTITETKNIGTNHSASARHQFYNENFDATSSTHELIKLVRNMYAGDIDLGSYNYEKY